MTDHQTDEDRSALADADADASVSFSFEQMPTLAVDLFHRAVVARGLRHNHVASVAVGEDAPGLCRGLGTVEFERVEDGSTHLLLSVDGGALLSAQLSRRSAHLSVAAGSPALAARVLATAQEAIERAGVPGEIELTMARVDPRLGLAHTTRSIPAPDWAEIAGNYTPGVAERLGRLVAGAPEGGSLLLWHGTPGTGKTWALRALLREWQEWCQGIYVVDPENMLGSRAYVAELSMGRASRRRDSRLLILEDAGELIAADARTEAGQALSRLLNLTDGLLGAGSGTLTLISTNEPLDKLHPAIQRPGRTAARIEFEPLPAGQANEWLAARDTDERVSGPATLAELYARVRGSEDQSKQRAPLGFAA